MVHFNQKYVIGFKLTKYRLQPKLGRFIGTSIHKHFKLLCVERKEVATKSKEGRFSNFVLQKLHSYEEALKLRGSLFPLPMSEITMMKKAAK